MELVGGTVAVVSLRIDAVEGLDGENHILIRLILHCNCNFKLSLSV